MKIIIHPFTVIRMILVIYLKLIFLLLTYLRVCQTAWLSHKAVPDQNFYCYTENKSHTFFKKWKNMATNIPHNEKLSGIHQQWPIVSRPENFPKFMPFDRSAKRKNCMRISPCGSMMTKYWHNSYINTRSKIRCSPKCVDVAGSNHVEALLSVTFDATDIANDNCSLRPIWSDEITYRFTQSTADPGFSMKHNYGRIDECQGIKASVVVYKTGVTEYWFYRRGFISTIHYKTM